MGERADAAPGPLTWTAGTDVPSRYADLSHDHSPVHLDAALAQREGLPGVVLHGMHVLAQVVGHLDRSASDGQDLHAVSLRFLDVTVPGEPVVVEFDRTGDAVAFTGTQSGRAVLGSGEAAYGPSLDV